MPSTTVTSRTNYLITGANRGLGRGLVAAYVQHPNSLVIATVRNPEDPSSQSLSSLPKHETSQLIVVRLESKVHTSAGDAIASLKSVHNLTALDVVIANAGIANDYPLTAEVKISQLQEHIDVNVYGVLTLFQATLPLLKQSTKSPKFVSMSSLVGSIGSLDAEWMPQFPHAAYGPSKAMLNWLTKKMHLEHPDLIVFPLHPGWVQTEMGNSGARFAGLEEAPETLEDSVKGMVALIDSATREATSGKFLVPDGKELPW